LSEKHKQNIKIGLVEKESTCFLLQGIGEEKGAYLKIAFWSNVRQESGVTTNLACMAALSAIAGMGQSIMLENHYNLNNLGRCFLPEKEIKAFRENGSYYSKYGMEYLMKRLYSDGNGEQLIRQASIPLLYSTMYYLPQSYIFNREIFNYEMKMVQEKLFQCLDAFSDIAYIDTESNQNMTTKSILHCADMIVVNLTQEERKLNDLFENYGGIREKSVFLVGKYEIKRHFSCNDLCKKYQIPKSKIGKIPYSMELLEAIQEGHVLQFLNRNYFRSSSPENEYLLRELRRSAYMIRSNYMDIKRKQIQGESISF
jgi:hypothetical protein